MKGPSCHRCGSVVDPEEGDRCDSCQNWACLECWVVATDPFDESDRLKICRTCYAETGRPLNYATRALAVALADAKLQRVEADHKDLLRRIRGEFQEAEADREEVVGLLEQITGEGPATRELVSQALVLLGQPAVSPEDA